LQEVNINKVLEERIQFWESQKVGEQKVKIIREFNINIPALLLDKEQLRQVILNMILNACEAMPDGGQIKITTNLDSRKDTNRSGEKGDRENSNKFLDNDYVKIEFEDTGIGIAKKDLHEIFDPFFTTKINGTGIGLSTVSRIIEKHKGMIKVESKEGQGTKFVVLFPLTQEVME
jgi:two-component system NtrC family sensor kinase